MNSFAELARDCHQTGNQPSELFAQSTLKRSIQWDGVTMKSLETERDAGVGLRLFEDGRMGFAYANEEEADAEDLHERARSIQRMMPPDENRGFLDMESTGSVTDRWLDSSLRTQPDRRLKTITQRIESMLERESLETLQVLYTGRVITNELFRNGEPGIKEQMSRCRVGVWAICGEGDETRTGWANQGALRWDDLRFEQVLETAYERGHRQLGSRPPKSYTGALLLAPDAASSLLRLGVQMLDGEAVAKGRSAWGPDRIGEQVADPSITILDDPDRAEGGQCRTYDAEGQPMRPVHCIREGRLEDVLTNGYYARRLKRENTRRASRSYQSPPGIGTSNFYVEPGNRSRDDLEQTLGDGPVVTSIQPGSGLDPVAGHFSVGAKGYLLENGTMKRPFHEGTLSGDFEPLLKRILHVGEDLPGGYSTASPSLLVERLSLGGE